MKDNKKINNILEEILKQNPDLKKDKKQLEKVVKILSSNNPEFKASKKFKSKLKSRLDGIIEFKKGNITPRYNYFQIFSGVFTAVFVMFWFFYVMQDSLFVLNENKQESIIKKTTITESSQDERGEKQEETNNDDYIKKVRDAKTKILENKKKSSIEEVKEIEEETKKFQSIPPAAVKIEKTKVSDEEKLKIDGPVIESFDIGETEDKQENDKQKEEAIKDDENETSLEDDGDSITGEDLGIDDTFLEEENDEAIEEDMPDNAQFDSMQLKSTWFDEERLDWVNWIVADEFQQFCNDIWWIFIVNEEFDICTYNKKDCNRNEYNTWNCSDILELDNDIDINLEELINEFSDNNLLDEK